MELSIRSISSCFNSAQYNVLLQVVIRSIQANTAQHNILLQVVIGSIRFYTAQYAVLLHML